MEHRSRKEAHVTGGKLVRFGDVVMERGRIWSGEVPEG